MPSAGLRQPWYAKLFAPAPDGTDSSHGAAGMGGGSQKSADAMQPGLAGRLLPPDATHAAASMAAPSGVAATDLSSALEAFMGGNGGDEDTGHTAAQPSVDSSSRSAAGFAAVPQPASALEPQIAAAVAPVPARTDGYAALADGYLGAPKPVQAAPSAAATSFESDQGLISRNIGGEAAAPTAMSAFQPTDAPASLRAAQLGRPVSFQASRSL